MPKSKNDFIFSFGTYKGKKLVDVPKDYLIWLANNGYLDKKDNYVTQELNRRGIILEKPKVENLSLAFEIKKQIVFKDKDKVRFFIKEVSTARVYDFFNQKFTEVWLAHPKDIYFQTEKQAKNIYKSLFKIIKKHYVLYTK